MNRVRIRSTLLLCVALIVDGCCLGMYTGAYAFVDCGTKTTEVGDVEWREYGQVLGMPWGPMCVDDNGGLSSMVWHNEYQINQCKSSSWSGSSMQCKEYEESGDAFSGAQALTSAAMFFNNFVALSALLELLGYTVGSKCQAAYVITGGVLTTVLCLAGGALCFAAGMSVGDKDVSVDFCNICFTGGAGSAYDYDSIKNPTIAGAPIGALVGGLFAITEVVIGILMCAQADRDKETLTSVETGTL